MPSISSDQFQAVARSNDEDYRDSTIEPGAPDDLADDWLLDEIESRPRANPDDDLY